jgi:hypothetical protein
MLSRVLVLVFEVADTTRASSTLVQALRFGALAVSCVELF